MMFDAPLTEKDLGAPHKAVMENKRSMSVLERSFYRQNASQIAQWDEVGVLQAAMAGKVPRVRRKYSKTLLDFFLARSPLWWSYTEHAAPRAQVMERLWTLGASEHVECFNDWLLGCLGDGFADTLLAAGANPHANPMRHGFRKNAVIELLQAIHRLRPQEGSRPRVDDGFLAVLRDRFDRCLSTPGATQRELDSYLGEVTRLSRWGADDASRWWQSTMEKLLKMGARPGFGFDGALSNLPAFHASDYGVLWLSGHLDREKTRIGRELDDGERQDLQDRLRWREMVHSARAARHALRLLTVYRSNWDVSGKECLSEVFWERLLHTPGGQGVARKLLDAGVPAPWCPGQSPHNVNYANPTILADYTHRSWRRLRQFARITVPQGVDPKWAQQSRKRYLSNWRLNENRVEQETPHAAREVECILQALPPHGALSPELLSWITQLPDAWSRCATPSEDRQDLMKVLEAYRLPHALLALPIFPSSNAVIEFVKKWQAHPESEALLSGDPRLAMDWKIQVAALCCQQNNFEKIVQSVREAVEAHPPSADRFVELAWDRFGQRRDIESCLSLVSTLQGLSTAQGSEPALEKEWVKAVVGRVNDNWSEAQQRDLIRKIKVATGDFDACLLPALNDLLLREASHPSRPTAMAKLLPLVVAMIDEGLDLAHLGIVTDPTRPLGCAVAVAREYALLQQTTSSLLGPTRSRRL